MVYDKTGAITTTSASARPAVPEFLAASAGRMATTRSTRLPACQAAMGEITQAAAGSGRAVGPWA
jgi:hypothetical protein